MSAVPNAFGQPRVHTIRVATDFTRTPGGRSPKNGRFNGEEFRMRFLEPALKNIPVRFDRVVVDLDGVDTYIGSFLEESFGGLLRGTFETLADVHRALEIKASGEFVVFRELAMEYMRDQDIKNTSRG